eukprot:3242960-Pyramimonas_sp.AAC.1
MQDLLLDRLRTCLMRAPMESWSALVLVRQLLRACPRACIFAPVQCIWRANASDIQAMTRDASRAIRRICIAAAG